ncbi:MAG TPA: hypothetical protein VLZ50_07635 [Terracidiphilus sp.]|nr:hypothetical protein [Terracidiphilus sp.]
MLRARRLKLIAESNKPVFTSTETEWWLAEAPAKQESTVRNAPDNSVKAADLKKEVSPSSNASAQDATAEAPTPASASSTFDFQREPAPVAANSAYEYTPEPAPKIAAGFLKKEELTWDAKMSCFVMA